MSVYIIAEAGVNHNGSVETAKKLVDAAARAGADAVKFQTFKAENIAGEKAPKAIYQKRATGSKEKQLEMLKTLELDEKSHEILIRRCSERKIQFLSSPFDIPSLDLLVKKLRLRRIKIASGEITNAPLLLEAGKSGRPIILSTGMCTLPEIRTALGVLAFGYTKERGAPSRKAFLAAYESGAGRLALKKKVVLLQCTTEYPTPFEDANLLSMDTLKNTFLLPVGLSDHTTGITVPIAAAARGAVIIEKHLTLDRLMPGPDHQASLEPDEFSAMVKAIHQVESALGSPLKRPAKREIQNRAVARKSLVAACDIRKGDIFTESNLAVKRPGTGASPLLYWDCLGKKARRSYRKDEAIER
jgi:N-acetylneuraminate synthase